VLTCYVYDYPAGNSAHAYGSGRVRLALFKAPLAIDFPRVAAAAAV